MATSLRYALAEQLHISSPDPADPDADMVVTLQRWTAKTGTKQVFVRCHDGIEQDRRLATTDVERNALASYFTGSASKYAAQLLSDEAAGDLVARRGGPHPRYCGIGDCGAQIPYAGFQCAEGHPVTQVEPGRYTFGNSRRPPITLITGGKK